MKVWLETEEERGGGHTVYTRTETIMLQQHQSFLLTVISDRLPHPTPDQARQLYQALRRMRRERGRQEGHLRGIDAKDIRALLTGRRGEEEEEGQGSGKGKSIYHWILLFWSLKWSHSRPFVQPSDMISSSHVENTACREHSLSFNPWSTWVTSPLFVGGGGHKTQKHQFSLSLKKEKDKLIWIFSLPS